MKENGEKGCAERKWNEIRKINKIKEKKTK
jgi:hypothetical protein